MPGLPDDWEPPAYTLYKRAWEEHPERERLAELKREVDADGNPTWRARAEDDGDDPTWTAIWFRSLDPRDPRPDIRITRYSRAWEEQTLADAQAIADEHADD